MLLEVISIISVLSSVRCQGSINQLDNLDWCENAPAIIRWTYTGTPSRIDWFKGAVDTTTIMVKIGTAQENIDTPYQDRLAFFPGEKSVGMRFSQFKTGDAGIYTVKVTESGTTHSSVTTSIDCPVTNKNKTYVTIGTKVYIDGKHSDNQQKGFPIVLHTPLDFARTVTVNAAIACTGENPCTIKSTSEVTEGETVTISVSYTDIQQQYEIQLSFDDDTTSLVPPTVTDPTATVTPPNNNLSTGGIVAIGVCSAVVGVAGISGLTIFLVNKKNSRHSLSGNNQRDFNAENDYTESPGLGYEPQPGYPPDSYPGSKAVVDVRSPGGAKQTYSAFGHEPSPDY